MGKVLVQGINVDVTDAIESHTQDQFKKVFEHFDSLIVEQITAKLKVSTHHSHINEITLQIPIPGNDITIEDSGDDMYKVISSVAQKANRKLRKVKEKMSAKSGRDKREQPE